MKFQQFVKKVFGKEYQSKRHQIYEFIGGTILCMAIFDTLSSEICYFNLTTGPSMLPTVNNSGDYAIVNTFSLQFEGVKRGDVVIAKKPENPLEERVCKRVTAIAGDTVIYHKRWSPRPQVIVIRSYMAKW